MRTKRILPDEQMRLIIECRQSGLSDYQWCRMNDIPPSTFYTWISRLRKIGMTIPESSGPAKRPSVSLQEVVKVNLLPDSVSMPAPVHTEQNTLIEADLAAKELPAVEILIGNATIRFYNSTNKSLVETTLKCMGGALLC